MAFCFTLFIHNSEYVIEEANGFVTPIINEQSIEPKEYLDELYGYYHIRPINHRQKVELDNELENIHNQLEGMTDAEKVRYIYDYICVYDYEHKSPTYNSTIYGILCEHKGSCLGYASTLYYLLNEEGIECRIITGESKSNSHT